MPMAGALREHLGIPAEVLLQEPGATLANLFAGIDWDRFPVKAMAKLGWIPNVRNLEARAEEFIRDLIRRAGGAEVAGAAFYRRNDHARANAKTDPYALKAWCWKVLADANETRPSVSYKPGTVTLDFLRRLAGLSWSDDGPRLAKEFLAKHGMKGGGIPHRPVLTVPGEPAGGRHRIGSRGVKANSSGAAPS